MFDGFLEFLNPRFLDLLGGRLKRVHSDDLVESCQVDDHKSVLQVCHSHILWGDVAEDTRVQRDGLTLNNVAVDRLFDGFSTGFLKQSMHQNQ